MCSINVAPDDTRSARLDLDMGCIGFHPGFHGLESEMAS
jgi:hypothetical protein